MRGTRRILSSDELRQLTRCGTTFLQIQQLDSLRIPYTIDDFGQPIVKTQDVQRLFDVLRSFLNTSNLNSESPRKS